MNGYIHVWNERMNLRGMVLFFCKCKKWLPSLCMGYKDTVAARMDCREYLCPECCENLPEGELTGRPIYTVEEFLAIRERLASPKLPITG